MDRYDRQIKERQSGGDVQSTESQGRQKDVALGWVGGASRSRI